MTALTLEEFIALYATRKALNPVHHAMLGQFNPFQTLTFHYLLQSFRVVRFFIKSMSLEPVLRLGLSFKFLDPEVKSHITTILSM
jgi:hypothetical protein